MKIIAGLSDVVYHATCSPNNILKTNKFILTFSKFRSVEDVHSPNPLKYHYYMAVARSKTSSFISSKTNSVTLVLDGRKLGQRYKAAPIDYFKDFVSEKREFEQEDRIFHSKKIIPDARKYIKEIQVISDSKNEVGTIRPDFLRTIALAKKYGIKVTVFKDRKSLIISNRRNAFTEEEINDALRGHKNTKKESPHGEKSTYYMEIWMRLYELMQAAIKENRNFYQVLRAKGYTRSRYAKKIPAYEAEKVFSQAAYSIKDYLMNELSTKPSTSYWIKKEEEFSRFMRRIKARNPRELADRYEELYREYSTQEKIRRNKQAIQSMKRAANNFKINYKSFDITQNSLEFKGVNITKATLKDFASAITVLYGKSTSLVPLDSYKNVVFYFTKRLNDMQIKVARDLGFSATDLYVSKYASTGRDILEEHEYISKLPEVSSHENNSQQ